MKLINKLSYVFVFIFCFACFFGNFVNASTAYDIGEYVIETTVKKNGDLHVVEMIRFDFIESANGIYRDILYKYNYATQKDNMEPTSSRYQASDIYNVLVLETDNNYNEIKRFDCIDEANATNGMGNVYSITNEQNDGLSKRIKIYTPSEYDQTKYFKIEYDLSDVAVLYNDKGEIYWNFVGKGWDCYISNLKVNVDFQEQSTDTIKCYPHGYTQIVNVSNFNGKVSFEVPNLTPGTAVDARIIFPSECLNESEVTKKINENYNFEELEIIEKGMQMGKTRHNLSNKITIVIIVLTIIYFILLNIESSKVISKGKKKKVEYFTEPLEKLELTEYITLNGGTIANSSLLIATILDLKHKKVLDMNAQKKLKKSFNGIEYDYYLTLNEKADFTKLTEYEILVLNYLFNMEVDKKISDFKDVKIELNERFKELGKKYSLARKFNLVCTTQDKKLKDEIFEKPDKTLKKFAFISLIVIFCLELINIFVISPINIDLKMENFSILCCIAFLLLMFVVILAYVRGLKEKYYEEYNQLKGLEKYLKEYSLIKDRYPIEIELWDRYLVFATLFGIAKKVAKEFKEELIKNGYDEDYIYINYPILTMSMNSNELASYAASSTGSSSSGGYSGGGSGGGGGGGGGGGSF